MKACSAIVRAALLFPITLTVIVNVNAEIYRIGPYVSFIRKYNLYMKLEIVMETYNVCRS